MITWALGRRRHPKWYECVIVFVRVGIKVGVRVRVRVIGLGLLG